MFDLLYKKASDVIFFVLVVLLKFLKKELTVVEGNNLVVLTVKNYYRELDFMYFVDVSIDIPLLIIIFVGYFILQININRC